MFRRFVHFEVLVIDKYRYGENIFPRDGKSADSISTFVFRRFSYGEKLVWGGGGPGQRNPQEIYPVQGQNFTMIILLCCIPTQGQNTGRELTNYSWLP
jgi:hypothetical protein